MTIHAYTEPHNDYPAYVNLSESQHGLFTLTVRSQGDGGRNSGTIRLTREDLLNLINDASEYLDADPQATKDAAAKNLVAAAPSAADNRGLRAHALEMALRTPGLGGHHDVLKAAEAYQAHIAGPAAPSAREQILEELLRSACAIADRKGECTAWERFAASIHAVGLNGVTARTYRILPSDEQ